MPFKFIAACFSLLSSLIMAAQYLVKGQPANALVAFLCGGIVAALFLGIFKSIFSEGYKAATALAMMIGLFAILSSNSFFNTKLQQGYSEALLGFAHMDIYCPSARGLEQRRITEYGFAACALRHNSDALSATTELHKSVHFGPALTLADSAATLSKDKEINHCARAFKEAERLCPLAFSGLSAIQRAALLDAAGN